MADRPGELSTAYKYSAQTPPDIFLWMTFSDREDLRALHVCLAQAFADHGGLLKQMLSAALRMEGRNIDLE